MPKAEFLEDFDWRPSQVVLVAYKAGMVLPVTRDCFDAAKAAGKARLAGRARNDEAEEIAAAGADAGDTTGEKSDVDATRG